MENERFLIVGIWDYSKDEDNPIGDYFEVAETEDYGDHIQFSLDTEREGVDTLEIRLPKEVLRELAAKYL